MSKKSLSRVAAEQAEDMPMTKNDVPETRVQADQQVASTESALNTHAEESSFKPKRSKAKGSALKQQTISDAITGSSSSAGMGINAAGRNVSGTAGGILGANNSTPQAGQSRSGSRVGKKLDRTATKLNYTPCETVLLEVDESKPLADASGEDQGYNGTYRNEFARSQKLMGAVPADLMFQRSVDLILKDKLYFVEGQMLFQGLDDNTKYNPQTRIALDLETNQLASFPAVYHTGNFLHKKFHFGLRTDGTVRYFYADVDDLSINGVSAEAANSASAHRLIKSNVAELDRIAMDAKAGDEKADIWSPLPRAIDEPTAASFLMSSIEADTGAYVYLAYSKATTNMAYQLNRGPKDGLDVVSPAIEQIVGWRSTYDDEYSLAGAMGRVLDNNGSHAFTQTSYRAGDPSLMIAAYDSVAKYHNKADLLLQPRGFRMHLQTADNNINPLRVPDEFANVYAANECFSTIDREYDPLMPICMTDKANLITSHNINELCAFFEDSGYRKAKISLTYTKIANGYENDKITLVEANVPAKLGWPSIYISYLKTSQDGDVLEYDGTNHNVRVKAHNPSGSITAKFNILVTGNTDDIPDGYTTIVTIADAANVTYDISLLAPKADGTVTAASHSEALNRWEYYHGGEYGYRYSDLRNNYWVEVKHPLINGIIEYLNESIGSRFRALLGQEEFTLPLIFSTQYMTLAQLVICAATPWISRVRMNSMKDVIYYQENVGSYPYSKLSSIKDVPFKNYLNFSYSDYDSPLETKVMNPVQAIGWIMPEFFWKVDTGKYVLPWYMNELDLNADGTVNDDASNMSMPSIRSGIRLGLLDNFYGMSEKDIRLSLDRITKHFLDDSTVFDSFGAYKYGRTTDGQILANLNNGQVISIGKILKAPRELGLCMDAPLGVLTPDIADGEGLTTALKALTADGTASSFRIKLWANHNMDVHPEILAAKNVNIARAANYTQEWHELVANNATSNTDLGGLVFGMGDDPGVFSPFAALGTGASLENNVNVFSYQRSLNTRIQFLPFVISPFDGNHVTTYAWDVYDFAYMFGLCGFRASDYRESVYNREKQVVNEGLLFINDPWVLDSPLIRGAIKDTGVSISKGYELK